MFVKHHFGPVALAGPGVPRIFAYENILDTMDEMKQPGYFNDMRIVLRPNSRIEVIASDFHGSIFVLGVVDEQMVVYKDDIRTHRGDCIIPKDKKNTKKKGKAA